MKLRLPTAVAVDDDVEPEGSSDAESGVDAPEAEADDEADDDIEIDPDFVKPAD